MLKLNLDKADISIDGSNMDYSSERNLEINSKIKTLLTRSVITNNKSIYSHLTACIKKVLEERTENPLDVFENISRDVTEEKNLINKEDTDISIDAGLAEIQRSLFTKGDGEGDNDEQAPDDDVETPLPNMWLHAFFYEQAGIGLNREELERIWLAMKTLVNTQPVEHARFWGKMFGLQQNYYIAEIEFREGEEIEEEEEETELVEEERPESKEDDEEEVEDLPPKSVWKPLPIIPKEEFRTGANKKIYFVCNEPGKPWIRLPHVTPAQIQIARKIKKIFTGCLDSEVKCFPPFPGLEVNLLRAQIARITSSTQISPIGFYTFDNEEEEETEEDGNHETFVENQEYVPPRIRELVDASFANWVHHSQHILPQGRCIWWNPNAKKEDEFDEGEEEEAEEETVQPEIGPSLLTPISHDVSAGGVEPWSVRLSSKTVPEYGVATVSSNRWPGAHAFSFGKHYQNIYIGWGYKSHGNYCPPRPGPVMGEYTEDVNTRECSDPSPADERALKASQSVHGEEHEQEEEEEDD